MKKFYVSFLLSAIAVLPAVSFGANAAESAPKKKLTYTPQIIYVAPGVESNYVMSSYSLMQNSTGEYMMGLDRDGFNVQISIDEENHKAYIKNPISSSPTGTYIYGDLNEAGDVITCTLPQSIGYFGDYQQMVYAAVMVKSGNTYGVIPTQTVTYTKDANGAWTMHLPTEESIMGVCDELEGYYYMGEKDVVYTPFTDVQTQGPAADLTQESWTLAYQGDGYPVTVVFDDDQVYFRGLSDHFPYTWVKGTVKGDKIEMDPFQYLGTDGGYYTWLAMCGTDFDSEGQAIRVLSQNCVFNYDAENRRVTCPDDQILAVNCSKKLARVMYEYGGASIFPQITEGSLVPQTPILEYFYPKIGKWGTTWVEVTIPRISVDGLLLDSDKLFYRIYLNSFQLEYDKDVYELPETIDELPWGFEDDDAFFIRRMNGARRYVQFFQGGVTEIDVESIYRIDGKEYFSERSHTEYEPVPDGVESVVAGKEIKGITYYDMTGCKVASPAAGIYVEVIEFADGEKRTRKVCRK